MSKRTNTFESGENPFALSIGDLMAALLLIFVLLLASTLLKLQDEFDNKSMVAERYNEVKENLYIVLNEEFKADLLRWNAEIDKANLSIRFKEPDVLFDKSKYEVKTQFRKVLSDFFPRYIKVLSNKNFKNNIEEIRIEGHTDSDGPTIGKDKDYDYFYNMELSQERTKGVLQLSLQTLESTSLRKWVQERLTANGLSSSKTINYENGLEDKKSSRRVEFKIRTNAEEQILEILKYGDKK